MDIGLSQIDWQHGTSESRGGQEIAAPLDWHGLTARLTATLAYHRAMADLPAKIAQASFDPASAQQIASYAHGDWMADVADVADVDHGDQGKNRNYESAVNPNISVIGKETSVIEAPLPTQTRSAIEG